MDLYGIPLALAGPPDKENYETQTARYLEEVYNAESRQNDVRSAVSKVTASVTITGQVDPEGNTAGNDCDSIDTLTVTFFLEMRQQCIGKIRLPGGEGGGLTMNDQMTDSPVVGGESAVPTSDRPVAGTRASNLTSSRDDDASENVGEHVLSPP